MGSEEVVLTEVMDLVSEMATNKRRISRRFLLYNVMKKLHSIVLSLSKFIKEFTVLKKELSKWHSRINFELFILSV